MPAWQFFWDRKNQPTKRKNKATFSECSCNLTLLVCKALTAITTCVLHLQSVPHLLLLPTPPPFLSTSPPFKTTLKLPSSSSPLSQTEQNQRKTQLHKTKPLPLSAKIPASRECVQAKDRLGWGKGRERGGEGLEGSSITLWEAENEGAQHSTGVGSQPCLCH